MNGKVSGDTIQTLKEMAFIAVSRIIEGRDDI